MADADISNSHNEEIVRYEHALKNVGAKRVSVQGYDVNQDSFRSIASVPNGDGTYSLSTAPGLRPGVDYDYIDGQQTSATVETYVYKLGGSGGTVVQTIVVTYTDSSKTDIDTVVYS